MGPLARGSSAVCSHPAGCSGRPDRPASAAGTRLDTPRVSGSNVFLSRNLDCFVYFAQLETRFAAHQIARREYSVANVVRSNNSIHIRSTDPWRVDAPYQLGAGNPGF